MWSLTSYLFAAFMLRKSQWLSALLFFQASIVNGAISRLEQMRADQTEKEPLRWMPDVLVGVLGILICLTAFLFEYFAR